MKSQSQKIRGYNSTARAKVQDKYTAVQDTQTIDTDYLASCVNLAITQVAYIHVPATAARIYLEKYPAKDNRQRVKSWECATCGYIGATSLDTQEVLCECGKPGKFTLEISVR